MLHDLTLDGFRSFRDSTAIKLSPLSIFAGPNNVGKSSVIQILQAFVQSKEARSGANLLLSGPWCDLGLFDQVVTMGGRKSDHAFAVGLRADSARRQFVVPSFLDVMWRFGAPIEDRSVARIQAIDYCCDDVAGQFGPDNNDDETFTWTEESNGEMRSRGEVFLVDPGSIAPIVINGVSPLITTALGHLFPTSVANVHAVGPFRMPPQAVYAPRMAKVGPPIGRYGEHTAELLWRHRSQVCDLIVPGASEAKESRKPVLSALNDWWSYIFEGKLALQIDVPARLGYTLAIDTPSADSLSLGQVGIGLSQALPIVATAVVSKPGDLVMIETPEAHLHPGAQHRLANMIIELARRGRQVIVETHSEHIVNAVQLAVKNGFPVDQQSILFFGQDDGRTTVDSVPLDARGKALRLYPGFFDQAMIDMAELLR